MNGMIPATIHQVHFVGKPDSKTAELIQSVKAANPNFKHILWDEQSVSSLGLNYGDLARKYPSPAGPSNVVRMKAVYEHGGIYLDTDMLGVRPMDDLLMYGAFIPDKIGGHYCAAAFGAAPQHPWVEAHLDECSKYVGCPAGWMSDLTDSLTPNDGVTIIPTDTFYPTDWTAPTSWMRPTRNTYAVHLWAKTWWSAVDNAASPQQKAPEGWFDFHDLYDRIANECPPGGEIAEVGVWQGASICYLASRFRALQKPTILHAVDLWPDEYEGVRCESYKAFNNNVLRFGFGDIIKRLRSDSAAAAKLFFDKSLFAVFIDGDHSYDGAKRDILAWLPKVRSGGIIGGHDIGGTYPGVLRAVNEIFGNDWTRMGECWFH
jgi:hypothetical protein